MTNLIDPRMNSRLSPENFEKLIKGNPPRMGTEAGSKIIFTGAVRLSWPSLHQREKLPNGTGEGKYAAQGLFPHKNIDVLRQACVAAIREHYPNIADPTKFMNPHNKSHPLKDQGLNVTVKDGGLEELKDRSTSGYVPGLAYINAKSQRTVPCMRAVAGRSPEVVMPGEIATVLYAGCWVDMKLVLLKSGTTGNPGVFWGLQGVCKLADDNSFSSGGANAATVSDFAGTVSIEDPNENLWG